MKYYNELKTYIKRLLNKDKNELTQEEKEFLPAALEIVETSASPKAFLVVWLIISFVVIAVLWAIFGHVEEVAVATGKAVPAGYTKTVQAEDKGVVKRIHVKDGDTVKAGELLIELDTTLTAADLEQYRKEQAYYQLELSRLEAEQLDKPFVHDQQKTPAKLEDVQVQTQLYRSRLTEYRTKLRSSDQQLLQTQAAKVKEEAVRDKLFMQLEITEEQEKKMKQLVNEGAVSLFQYQSYQSNAIGLRQDLMAENMEILRLQHLEQQYQEDKESITNERQRDIATKIVEDRRQLALVNENIKKAEEKNRLSTIKAPIDGKVQQLSVHTEGAVVTAAEELMLIVPEGTPMEIEAWLENKDIGFVYEGQRAELKVETFNFQKYGTLPATVTTLSTDAVENKEGKLLYRVLLTPQETQFSLITGRVVNLAPGMSVTAEIKTKEKRIIEYFLDPFLKYKSEGLRER
jgi:HlyD family type I secretion membrane fusion protein